MLKRVEGFRCVNSQYDVEVEGLGVLTLKVMEIKRICENRG